MQSFHLKYSMNTIITEFIHTWHWWFKGPLTWLMNIKSYWWKVHVFPQPCNHTLWCGTHRDTYNTSWKMCQPLWYNNRNCSLACEMVEGTLAQHWNLPLYCYKFTYPKMMQKWSWTFKCSNFSLIHKQLRTHGRIPSIVPTDAMVLKPDHQHQKCWLDSHCRCPFDIINLEVKNYWHN